ncbi:MAG: hypothetical protein ACN6OK_05715 [Alcaligenes faecalis]
MKKGDADQLIRCMKECWWRVALVIAIPLALMAWVFWGSPVTMTLEDGAAAWVQAVGSIGAIVVAIYVLHKQKNDMFEAGVKAEDMSETRLLMALRTEITVRRDQYMERIGGIIASGQFREMGVFEWECPDNPFPIYTAMCKDLGLLKDDELRALVIQTYAEMEGLVYSIRIVRNVLADADEKDLLHHPAAMEVLQENYEMVEGHHALVESLANSLLDSIQTYLTSKAS